MTDLGKRIDEIMEYIREIDSDFFCTCCESSDADRLICAGGIIAELQAKLAALDKHFENQQFIINKLATDNNNLKEFIAPILGFNKYKAQHSEQIIWAETLEDAKSLQLGDSIYKFVDEYVKAHSQPSEAK